MDPESIDAMYYLYRALRKDRRDRHFRAAPTSEEYNLALKVYVMACGGTIQTIYAPQAQFAMVTLYEDFAKANCYVEEQSVAIDRNQAAKLALTFSE